MYATRLNTGIPVRVAQNFRHDPALELIGARITVTLYHLY